MFVVTDENRRWWTVAAMALPVMVLTIDFFGVSVALPSIGKELGSSTSSLAWVINAFMLGLAGVLVVGGRLGDLVGRRKMLLVGIVLFVGGSILCGLAQSDAWLIGGRAIQGVAAAFTYGNALSVVSNAFPADQRGVGIGIWIGIGSVGSAIGPFVGGLLTDELSWRWFFFLNVPFGIAAVIMALLVVRNPAMRARRQGSTGSAAFWRSSAVCCLSWVSSSRPGSVGSPASCGRCWRARRLS